MILDLGTMILGLGTMISSLGAMILDPRPMILDPARGASTPIGIIPDICLSILGGLPSLKGILPEALRLRRTLNTALCSSDTHSIGHGTDPIHTAQHPTHTSDRPSIGPHKGQILPVEDPKQIRYTVYGVLYSSDTDCVGFYAAPIHTVYHHIQTRCTL